MKKGLLITIGVVILILLVAVWIYLLFFGTPRDAGDIFTNLGFTGGEERTLPPEELPPTPILPEETEPRPALRQLTTRPVAGFQTPGELFEQTARFVERGTGHMFEVNLVSGNETQVSQLTVPQTAEAIFAPDNSSVIYMIYGADERSSFVALLEHSNDATEVADTIQLPPNATNLAYHNSESILYTLTDTNGTSGYRYNLGTQTRVELFAIPLQHVHMVWGNGLTDIYLYNKPSRFLDGQAYRIANNQLLRVHDSTPGLLYSRNNVVSLHTMASTRAIYSTISGTTDTMDMPVVLIPEKCAFLNADSHELWCGISTNQIPSTFPENWYRGQVSSDDSLWMIDVDAGTAHPYVDLTEASGRQIDVGSINISNDGFQIFLTNKLDHTLWIYDTLLAAGIDLYNE